MPDLCIDLTKVQEGLDLLDNIASGLVRLSKMHEDQSRRWAELLAFLKPNPTEPDLADHYLFICTNCGAKLDIENSRQIESALVCPCCYYDDRRAL